MRSELALEPQAGGGKMQRSCLRPFRLPMLPRRAGLAAVLLACLAAAPASAQPPGSNAGLPPSATPTGLAGQKIIALNSASKAAPGASHPRRRRLGGWQEPPTRPAAAWGSLLHQPQPKGAPGARPTSLTPPPPGVAAHTLMDEFKYSDIDLMSYLLNVECLEASFDT